MQDEPRAKTKEDQAVRLQTLAVPKRATKKFESHPYMDGRFNYNHFDERLHEGSFCPTVRHLTMKYKYSSAGLSCAFDARARVLEKLNADEKAKKKPDPKKFKEYAELTDDEILITIEHCTNCAEHQSNTRHIQEKYYLYAKTLKQAILIRYPMVKVYCKPISDSVEDFQKNIVVSKKGTDQKSLIIDNYRPEMRIGAFEVQLCAKVRGEQKVELLHSKLATRVWPNVGSVLNKIANYIPHTNINVKVYTTTEEGGDKPLQDIKISLSGNLERLNEIAKTFNESLQAIEFKKKEMMRTRKNTAQTLPPISETGPMATMSPRKSYNASRPMSAVTSRSMDSNKDGFRALQGRRQMLNKQGSSGTQYSQSRPTSAVPLMRRKAAQQSSNVVKTTDETGTATFDNVPINNYIIAVEESKNYMASQKALNLIAERTIQPLFTVFIELKPQVSSFVEIKLLDENGYRLDKATVTALLLSTTEMAATDRYLFDLFKTKNGSYSASLIPGDYVINAMSPGYKDISEYFCAVKGECPGEFKALKKAESKLTVSAVDLMSGTPIQGALVKLSTATGSMNVEGLTQEDGRSAYTTDGCGNYTLNVSREGYVSYVKEMCVSKKSLNQITVPLIPAFEEAERATIEVCISGDAASQGLSLVVYCPINNEVVDERKLESETNKVRIAKANAWKVGAAAIITSGVNEWYRVGVAIKDPQFTAITKANLDRYLQNPMQALNIVVQVVVNNEVKYTIYPPSYPAGDFWDIGFVNALNGEMMVINAMANEVPESRMDLCADYLAFYSYVSQKTNYRAAFGFDKAGIPKLDDLIMDPASFCQNYAKAAKMDEDNGKRFLQRLTSGLSDLFGNISLKLLVRLINLHVASACEMEYSKTLGSPGTKKLDFGFLKSSPSTQQKQPVTESKVGKPSSPPAHYDVHDEEPEEVPTQKQQIKPKMKEKEMPSPVKKAEEEEQYSQKEGEGFSSPGSNMQ